MRSRESVVTVVVDGQYGSTGKGAVCGHLAYEDAAIGQKHVGVRVGGSQAGHTVVDTEGRAWPMRHVPVAFVNPDADLVIAAGSEIDLEVLRSEVEQLEAAGHSIQPRLFVDPQATWLEDSYKTDEANADLTARIGSTGKGVGAARAARVMRTAKLIQEAPEVPGSMLPTDSLLQVQLSRGAHVVIEGTQGYGLGLHAGHYPKCTSTDCRAVDFLAQAGISPWAEYIAGVQVVIVVRTHPIRVAGDSGPLKGETSWAELGLEPELTTVTRKVRRVGAWDPGLVARAVEANGGPGPDVVLAVTMADHLFRELHGVHGADLRAHAGLGEWIEKAVADCGADVVLVGTAPGVLTVWEPGAWL